MQFNSKLLIGFVGCAAPFLIGAKPAPAPQPFVPALAYKYASQEIRLSNADGSQAVLLARSPSGTQPLFLSIAPISKRQVAFIEGYGGTARSVRLVSWTQQSLGGPLTVSIDPQPLFSLSGSDGLLLNDLDYSPDGTKLAVLATDYQARAELRIFDIATRSQIGDTIAVSQSPSSLAWRPSDGAILLRGPAGLSSYKDGVHTALFSTSNQTNPFDTFNGSSSELMLPYKGDVPNGPTYRWDGVTVTGGQPVLTKIIDGLGWSISCDNARMIFTEIGAKRTAYNLVLATGQKVFFSKDSNVQRMEYPNSCS
jgi:hypothetical protein